MPNPKLTLEDCLTVEDLLTILKQHDPKAKVFFEYPAHDHLRSSLAGAVESVEDEVIVWSDHLESFKVLTNNRDDDKEQVSVVILR